MTRRELGEFINFNCVKTIFSRSIICLLIFSSYFFMTTEFDGDPSMSQLYTDEQEPLPSRPLIDNLKGFKRYSYSFSFNIIKFSISNFSIS